ncbi:hypothetical protein KP509_16G036000 [Ceratopteris richardii]|uniref:Uncharacterized protein n=1 Tax=Ceratopteris richardii TaxID=49495 RepID=A0A8T2T240_CERRI|nr:hypothetical protein KP509_16G036000 [Ceratopteris richardii]
MEVGAAMTTSTAVATLHSSSPSAPQAPLYRYASPKWSHSCLGSRQAGLSLRQQKKHFASSSSSSPLFFISASAEFARREASKLEEFLNEELDKYSYLADVKGRIADVCAKALHNYVVTYEGGIDGKPIEDMKSALQQQGLPHQQALTCSIWWLRANLRRDYEQYCAAR